ncbi:MAG TPA: hypothetical protein VMB71_00655 [Acetobacteraceae bacterium]|nr:hypothetical protein [Acetobacteraceae bacterium]
MMAVVPSWMLLEMLDEGPLADERNAIATEMKADPDLGAASLD